MNKNQLELDIRRFIERGCGSADEETFEELAMSLFRFQYGNNDFYRRFVDTCATDMMKMKSWADIPCLPVSAFKHARIACFPPDDTKCVFRTSGTTAERRGEFALDDLSLYELALTTSFKFYCLPDVERMTMASLIPSAPRFPDSSLSYMISTLFKRFGTESSSWFCEADAPHHESCSAFLEKCARKNDAVMIFGTAIRLWSFMDFCSEQALNWILPPGSRLMETGGFKGSRKKITKGELYERLMKTFGIPTSHMINEYGMTEMGSQFYGTGFRNTLTGANAHTFKEVPPWVRTRVLDPRTGESVEVGQQGILCHYDLANVGTVFALETGDLGIRVEEGFEIVGRVLGSELRGCSLKEDEKLFA